MKTAIHPTVFFAILLALFRLLFVSNPVFAADPPPPEPPAAPITAVPAQALAPSTGDDETSPQTADTQPLAAKDLQPYLGSDPWFKVGSVIHRYMTDCTGQPLPCTQSTTPITAALNAIAGDLIPSDRYLYIEYSDTPYPDDDDVHIYGTHPNLAQLKGIRGNPNPTSGDFPTLYGNVLIESMPKGFVLSGIHVSADDSLESAVHFFNNYGTIVLQDVTVINGNSNAERGLYIQDHYGSLELSRVKVNDNPVNGAEIDTDGISGSVKITNSTFDANGTTSTPGYGLLLDTDLTVTIDSVSASRNMLYGLKIDRENKDLYPHNITITNSLFTGNHDGPDGFSLGLFTYGSVKLENLHVSDNESSGLVIENKGDVTIRHSAMINNQGTGVSLDTCGSETVVCPFLGAGRVTIQGLNTSGNSDFGLSVDAKGSVSVRDLLSLRSSARLRNQYGSGNISLTGILIDGALQHDGMEVVSRGSVTLKNITVNGTINGGGLIVDTSLGAGKVTLSASSGIINRFDQNNGTGISIVTLGNITLSTLSANRNGETSGAGAVLTNTAGGIKRKVSVSHGEVSENKGDGLFIASLGTVSLKDITALDNSSSGLDPWLDGDGLQVGDDPTGQPISVSLNNLNASDNASHGLHIASLGKVALAASSGLFNDFHRNGSDGANINTVGSISLKSVRSIDNVNGIKLVTNAPVVVTNAMTDANTGAGLFVVTSTLTGKVTIRQLSARDNMQEGLRVQAGAAVLLERITALSNGLSGVDEGYSGIYVTAQAQIVTLKSSLAMGNGKHGAHVENTLAPLVQSKNTLLGNNANGGAPHPDLLQQ